MLPQSSPPPFVKEEEQPLRHWFIYGLWKNQHLQIVFQRDTPFAHSALRVVDEQQWLPSVGQRPPQAHAFVVGQGVAQGVELGDKARLEGLHQKFIAVELF